MSFEGSLIDHREDSLDPVKKRSDDQFNEQRRPKEFETQSLYVYVVDL